MIVFVFDLSKEISKHDGLDHALGNSCDPKILEPIEITIIVDTNGDELVTVLYIFSSLI